MCKVKFQFWSYRGLLVVNAGPNGGNNKIDWVMGGLLMG